MLALTLLGLVKDGVDKVREEERRQKQLENVEIETVTVKYKVKKKNKKDIKIEGIEIFYW